MSIFQDVVAMSCLELAHRNGHWVILNNIHLMPSWLIELEKKLDEFALEGSHEKFRLYLSSDPSNAIPIGVLSRCIKLTNEPPAGLKANLKRAFANFSREYIEEVNQYTLSFGVVGACRQERTATLEVRYRCHQNSASNYGVGGSRNRCHRFATYQVVSRV